MRQWTCQALISACLFFNTSELLLAQDAILSKFENTYRNGVVKVSVSALKPVIEDNKNLCVSEGTGFIVARSRIVTASHVLSVHEKCEDIIIIVRSRWNNYEAKASIIYTNSSDDLALLGVEGELPDSMCSLTLHNEDIYDVPAYRIGIPKDLQNPKRTALQIGRSDDDDFRPFLKMTTSEVLPGESGSPIFFLFNVVGVVKAQNIKDIGIMVKSKYLRDLFRKNGIVDNKEFECSLESAAKFRSTRIEKIPDRFSSNKDFEYNIPFDRKIPISYNKQVQAAEKALKAIPTPVGVFYRLDSKGLNILGDTSEIARYNYNLINEMNKYLTQEKNRAGWRSLEQQIYNDLAKQGLICLPDRPC